MLIMHEWKEIAQINTMKVFITYDMFSCNSFGKQIVFSTNISRYIYQKVPHICFLHDQDFMQLH